MKKIILLFISCFLISSLSAQEKKEKKKKVIVIETETEKAKGDGEVIIIKEIGDDVIIEIEEEIKYKYKIVTKDEEGNEKVMEWEGEDESEMPAELKEEMEQHEKENQLKKEKSKVKIVVIKDGEEMEYEFESEDGNTQIPADIQKELEAMGLDATMLHEKEHKEKNNNKAQLGVMIQNHEDGVQITDIIAGSSADEGGLMSGDVIKAVDGTMVRNIEELVAQIGNYYAGDEIKVNFTREHEEMSKSFILKERTPRNWEEAIKK